MTRHHHHLFERAASRQCTLIRLPAEDPHDRPGEDAIDAAVHTVLVDPTLRLAGVCRDLGTLTDPTTVSARVEETIARMDDIRREYAVIPTTLVLESEYDPTSGVDAAQHHQQLLEAVEEGLDTACERYRFPRPSFTLMLRTTAPTTHPTPASAAPARERRIPVRA
ncbi:MAG TPA: hypothetical protein VIW24_13875 [Aldersonia sp.]